MVSTVRPRATPSNPIPTSGNLAASTALPQPPSTNQNVPTNSADSRRPKALTDDHHFSFFAAAKAHIPRAVHKLAISEHFGHSARGRAPAETRVHPPRP